MSRPLDSCLNPSHHSTTNLARLLNLLVFSQKYLVHRLQAHLMSLVSPLTQTTTISSHLKNGLSALRVIEVATILNDNDMRTVARSIILGDLWLDPDRDASRDLVDPYDALIYGETIADKEVIGASYYRIAVSRDWSKPWDTRLSQCHIQNLLTGRNALLMEWQTTSDSWGRGAKNSTAMFNFPIDGTGGCIKQNWLHGVWVAIAQKEVELHDIVGRYRVVIDVFAEVKATGDLKSNLVTRIETLRTEVYSMFVIENES